jgi:hypothetical protein
VEFADLPARRVAEWRAARDMNRRKLGGCRQTGPIARRDWGAGIMIVSSPLALTLRVETPLAAAGRNHTIVNRNQPAAQAILIP